MLINDTNFSLSDLLHSVWQSLGPSMSLQVTQFCSSLWLSTILLHIRTTSSLSIPLLWKKFRWLHALAVYTVLRWTLGCMHLFTLWFSLDICRGEILLDHTMIFYFLRSLHTVLHSGFTNLHSTSRGWRILFSTLSPALTVCRLPNDGHSAPCEVIYYCSSDLHFSIG